MTRRPTPPDAAPKMITIRPNAPIPEHVMVNGLAYRLVPRELLRRPRAADSRTTSIKLPQDLFERLAAEAHRSGLTRHGIMKLAILTYLDGIENADATPAAGATQAAAGTETAAPDSSAHKPNRATRSDAPPPPGMGLTAAMARLIGQGVNPLRAIRGGRGFTIQRLAARLGDLGLDIDETLITQIETGEVEATPELRAALAKALGVEEEVLGE
ncbi:MAG TPA: helix-turn-helix domain-containing protein [Magnetospirillaceae bacterium]|jgi:predicted transcriptional regulator